MNPAQWEALIKIIELLVLPFAWYVVKTLNELTKKVNELGVVLIGVDGKNGLRSRVIRMERRIERLAIRYAKDHDEDDDKEDE